MEKTHQLQSNVTCATYAQVEETFAECTDHVANLIEYAANVFRPKAGQDSSLLDIGAGPGFVAGALTKIFGSVTALDPNKDYIPSYQKLAKNSTFQYVIGNFQDVEFDRKYSNILCSHMLYHVPQIQWGPLLLKMQQLLDIDGSGLILLTAPEGRFHTLCSVINPNYSHSGVLCTTLKKNKIDYSVEFETSTYREPDRQKFSDLVHIFAIDDCYLPEEYNALSKGKKLDIEDHIEHFIDSCFNHEQAAYELTQHSARVLIGS